VLRRRVHDTAATNVTATVMVFIAKVLRRRRFGNSFRETISSRRFSPYSLNVYICNCNVTFDLLACSRPTQRDEHETDGETIAMWDIKKIGMTSGTDDTGATEMDNLKGDYTILIAICRKLYLRDRCYVADDMKDMREMIARLEDRLDCYSNEIVTLKTENFRRKYWPYDLCPVITYTRGDVIKRV